MSLACENHLRSHRARFPLIRDQYSMLSCLASELGRKKGLQGVGDLILDDDLE